MTSAAPPSPAPLDLARLRRQDQREFARLVDTFQSLITSLAQSMGLRGPDIDDALADAFAAVYLALPRFEARSELSTWVYRIAARAILKVRRRRDRHRPPDPDSAPAPVDASPSPLDRAQANESFARVWSAVARLDPRQAQAVDLYYRQSWPVARIAEALECPENTVKTLLSRARERLRDMLKTDHDVEVTR